ncbi:MAG: hypothetical protein LH649_00425, partial [Pseudanabaena sp. CAN_BIN31]|nr:hypothetical protein [Pseudanabaena sp. CAN_BIN31]
LFVRQKQKLICLRTLAMHGWNHKAIGSRKLANQHVLMPRLFPNKEKAALCAAFSLFEFR